MEVKQVNSDDFLTSNQEDDVRLSSNPDEDAANIFEDVNHIEALKPGCQINRDEQESFETDVSNMEISVGSIILSLTDGEIENFIGRNKSTPSP